jgi:hypothetical protein
MLKIERTRCVCDHCNALESNSVIISLIMGDTVTDSIQLCREHAAWLSKELLKER